MSGLFDKDQYNLYTKEPEIKLDFLNRDQDKINYSGPNLNRDPVRFDSMNPLPYGRQIMNQLSPSPHQPLYPYQIGPLG